MIHQKDYLFQSIDLAIEVSKRVVRLLENIKVSDYIKSDKTESSVGDHVRHIVDFYNCLLTGLNLDNIDYDNRPRNASIAADPTIALKELAQIQKKLKFLYSYPQNKKILVRESISNEGFKSESYSTVERELMAVADHTVHHLAIINMIGRIYQKNLLAKADYQNFATQLFQNSNNLN